MSLNPVRMHLGLAAVFTIMAVIFSYVNFHVHPVGLIWWWLGLLEVLALGNFALALVYAYRRRPH